jgi:hypothetical protein
VVLLLGEALQVEPVWPRQVPPVQLYELAVGLQLALSNDEALRARAAGVAVSMQMGMPAGTP